MRFWVFGYAAILLVVLGAAVAVDRVRADPSTVPQETWHEMGTEAGQVAFHPLPRLREVVIGPHEESTLEHLRQYAFEASGGRTEEQAGRFSAEEERIYVLGDQACLEAGLPSPYQVTLRRTLRHEYGHALLYDFLVAVAGQDEGVSLYNETGTDRLWPPRFPATLRPSMEEYWSVPKDVYESEYYTVSYAEYMAESYARYLGGKYVPPRTRDFLRRLSRER